MRARDGGLKGAGGGGSGSGSGDAGTAPARANAGGGGSEDGTRAGGGVNTGGGGSGLRAFAGEEDRDAATSRGDVYWGCGGTERSWAGVLGERRFAVCAVCAVPP